MAMSFETSNSIITGNGRGWGIRLGSGYPSRFGTGIGLGTGMGSVLLLGKIW